MNIFHLTIIRINTVQINDYILNNIRTFTIIILGNNILIIPIDSFGKPGVFSPQYPGTAIGL